jgi:hypothetical protein
VGDSDAPSTACPIQSSPPSHVVPCLQKRHSDTAKTSMTQLTRGWQSRLLLLPVYNKTFSSIRHNKLGEYWRSGQVKIQISDRGSVSRFMYISYIIMWQLVWSSSHRSSLSFDSYNWIFVTAADRHDYLKTDVSRIGNVTQGTNVVHINEALRCSFLRVRQSAAVAYHPVLINRFACEPSQ